MNFQWLPMRIAEENDRRQREAMILERLPRVMDEVHEAIAECVKTYAEAFGEESIELSYIMHKARVTVREKKDARWESVSKVDITAVTQPLSLRIDRDGEVFEIEIGMLPGDKMFYK